MSDGHKFNSDDYVDWAQNLRDCGSIKLIYEALKLAYDKGHFMATIEEHERDCGRSMDDIDETVRKLREGVAVSNEDRERVRAWQESPIGLCC